MTDATPDAVATRLLLGIDAGGTKTICLLARADDGVIIGRGVGGPGNIRAVGAERVTQALAEATATAFAAAGLARDACTIVAATIGAAGAARDDDRAAVAAIVEQIIAPAQARITNDAAIALAAALPSGPGVLLISGTGSIGYGRAADGREVRAGGWGYLLDDAGSAYAAGLAGLSAVLRAHDGRGPTTTLSRSLLDAWELAAPDGIIARVYVQPPPRDRIAALAPLVLDAARASDEVAVAIVTAAGSALGELIVATIRQLGTPETATIPVVTDGGFLRAGADLLLPPLHTTVDAAGLRITQRHATEEAARGALGMAREML